MGIWNAHTSLGNILGTIIPSFWANPTVDDPTPPWGLSFIIPSLIMAVAAMLVFYLLVVGEVLSCPCDNHAGLMYVYIRTCIHVAVDQMQFDGV